MKFLSDPTRLPCVYTDVIAIYTNKSCLNQTVIRLFLQKLSDIGLPVISHKGILTLRLRQPQNKT